MARAHRLPGAALQYTVGARASADGSDIDRKLAKLVARFAGFSVKKKISIFVAELTAKGR